MLIREVILNPFPVGHALFEPLCRNQKVPNAVLLMLHICLDLNKILLRLYSALYSAVASEACLTPSQEASVILTSQVIPRLLVSSPLDLEVLR